MISAQPEPEEEGLEARPEVWLENRSKLAQIKKLKLLKEVPTTIINFLNQFGLFKCCPLCRGDIFLNHFQQSIFLILHITQLTIEYIQGLTFVELGGGVDDALV